MMTQLNALDVVILIILLLSVIFGLLKGLVRELLSLAFFLVAVGVSFLYYHDVGEKLAKHIDNPGTADFCGFIIIFSLIMIIGAVITYFIKKVFVVGPLKPIDRMLGGVFGLLRGALISGVIVSGLMVYPVNPAWVPHSRLSPVVRNTVDVCSHLIPAAYREKIKFINLKDIKP
ncbi:MAG: CvpA family protein [Candidatus Omnitrophota bacterium]